MDDLVGLFFEVGVAGEDIFARCPSEGIYLLELLRQSNSAIRRKGQIELT